MLHTEFGLQRLQGFPLVCYIPRAAAPTSDFIGRMTVASHSHNGTIVTCARVQIPLVTSTSAHVRSEISDRHGSAHGLWTRMVPRPGSARVGCGPRRPCCEAGYALQRNTPPGGLVGAVLHGSRSGLVVSPPATTGPAGEAMIHMSGSTSSFKRQVQVFRRIK